MWDKFSFVTLVFCIGMLVGIIFISFVISNSSKNEFKIFSIQQDKAHYDKFGKFIWDNENFKIFYNKKL